MKERKKEREKERKKEKKKEKHLLTCTECLDAIITNKKSTVTQHKQ
jgi:hypothetical protein